MYDEDHMSTSYTHLHLPAVHLLPFVVLFSLVAPSAELVLVEHLQQGQPPEAAYLLWLQNMVCLHNSDSKRKHMVPGGT